MQTEIILSGFGGQGIMFAGQILTYAAMDAGKEVTWIPSYGPEMRGGTAACTVILNETEIGSPVLDQFDAAVVMNLPSLRKFGPRVGPGGLLIVNTSLAETASSARRDIEELRLPCTELAAKGGDDKLVTVVALGALVARLGWVSAESVRAALREISAKKRPEVIEADLGVFAAGLEAGGLAVPA
jgi:2-oxoglutarate ferredoxin oxidoreductase subunit gamma